MDYPLYKLGIAEDEPHILKGLCDFYPWKDMGFDIVTKARDGQEILNFLNAGNTFDVLLCDIAMPMMDGLELAEFVCKHYPSVIVVFLSGYAEFSYAQQALKYRVFDYLLKPVKYDSIVDVFTKIYTTLNRQKQGSDSPEEMSYYESIIIRIHQYVAENLKTVSWKQVAHTIHISPNYLSFLYKKQTGRNFQDYLQEIKMQRAKTYLLKTDMRMYEIAEELGYTNPKNFSRAFRGYYNCSPQDFRRQGMLP